MALEDRVIDLEQKVANQRDKIKTLEQSVNALRWAKVTELLEEAVEG